MWNFVSFKRNQFNSRKSFFFFFLFVHSNELTMKIPLLLKSSYMAPEVFERRTYDEKVDVYSFGIILWEMIATKIPFYNESNEEIQNKVLNNLRPTIPPHCPQPIANLINDCWGRDPHLRPNFTEICRRLESFQAMQIH
jgi:serine/threonine protein kinase